MVIVAGFALGVAVSLGGVFAYSMAAVASRADRELRTIPIQRPTRYPLGIRSEQASVFQAEDVIQG